LTVAREPAGPMPLTGRRVLVTRPRQQVTSFVRGLEARGAQVAIYPTVEILPLRDTVALDRAIQNMGGYDWLIFTSANGVRHFLQRCEALGQVASLQGPRLGAIGPETARVLEEHDLRVEVVPREYRAEGILDELGADRVCGARFLLARVAGARDVLPETLRQWGGVVDVVEAYRSQPVKDGGERLSALLKSGTLDCVTFTSSSTVNGFFDMLEAEDFAGSVAGITVACIGPITAQTARDRGVKVHVEAREYTVNGLIRAIVEYYKARPR
jgi:uroporphyrinogen III methyltransferase / synthase